MIKRCYISNCRETVNFSCNCSAETIFVCVPHKDLHTTQGAHDIKSILAPLSPDEKKESLAKIILLLSQFDQSRKKVTQNAQEIIKSVIKKSSKVLAKIAEIESNLRNFYNLAKQDKPVDTDQFKLIQNMPTSEIPTRVPLLKEIEESLSSLFDVHDYSHEDAIDPDECSQVLYSDGRFAGNMLSICLSEFKQKQLTFAPKVMGQGQVCRVDSHLYFFNGGSGISGRNGETYLVDIRNRTYETFQNSTPRCGGGSVYANNKVYVFGG